MSKHNFLGLYEPAPWFVCASTSNPQYHFSALGGQIVIMTFLGSVQLEQSAKVNAEFVARKAHFDDINACWFGITIDIRDQQHLHEQLPGIRYFWDLDTKISQLYKAQNAESGNYWPCSYIIDRQLRIAAVVPFAGIEASQHVVEVMAIAQRLQAVNSVINAPVLIVPNVFEAGFCQHLMEYYHRNGGQPSGFMREENGRTVGRHDSSFKVRRDSLIEEDALQKAVNLRLTRRLLPEIQKAFHYKATRIERYLIACYSAEDGGFFRPHRDDTTKGTAHRQFAVTINLNAEDYEGGDLRFPEYGQQTYRAPSGGAVVFSCTLLHEATKVTRGTRYAVLPFLYNEEAALIRAKNQSFLEA